MRDYLHQQCAMSLIDGFNAYQMMDFILKVENKILRTQ